MELGVILLWSVGLSAALAGVATLRRRDGSRGWLAVCALLVVVVLAGALLAPTTGGYVAAALWFVLLVLPSNLLRYAQTLVSAQRYARARRVASAARWLHPLDGCWEQPRLIGALELAQRGEVDAAIPILERSARPDSPIGRLALGLLYRITGRWEDALALCDALPEAQLLGDPGLLSMQVRACGETGNTAGLLRAYERAAQRLEHPGFALFRAQIDLFLAAFTGRVAAVERLLAAPQLATLPAHAKSFWVATAQLVAGDADAANASLASLVAGGDPVVRVAAERRCAHALPGAEAFPRDAVDRLVAAATRRLDHEARFGSVGLARAGARARAIWALVALNVAVFVVEVLAGGSEDLPTLYRLGALEPGAVLRGAWWRVLSAGFLHYGALHLAMNMLGLLVLGAFVERSQGAARTVAVYLLSGTFAMLVAVVVYSARDAGPTFLVGASGSVMGMVGAEAVVLWRGWRETGAVVARRRLLQAASVVAIQVVFDLSSPRVSLTAHAAGVVGGLLFMRLFMRQSP